MINELVFRRMFFDFIILNYNFIVFVESYNFNYIKKILYKIIQSRNIFIHFLEDINIDFIIILNSYGGI